MKKYLLPIIFLFITWNLQALDLITDGEITGKIIDPDLAVGCVAGSASVSLSGNATYGIPIYIPEGIRGMQPNVSVSYSSGGGNGLLGYGWNLSAYSAISYDTKNLYNDNEVAPNYINGGSPFLLDGERLIPISGTEFRTESESFSKITYNTTTTSFTVITKSGITMEYGVTTNAKLTNSSSVPVKWFLNKTSDNIGNSIEYFYAVENNETLLKTITYTKNANVVSSFNNTITFNYTTRIDNNTFFSMDAITTTVEPNYKKNKLTSIEVKAEGVNVKRYDFAYGEDGLYTYLNEVTENGFNSINNNTAIPLNSTIFKYGLVTPTTNSSETFTPAASQVSGNKPELLTGDFNGDGLEDLFVAYYSQAANYPKKYSDYKVYLRNSTGAGFIAPTLNNIGTFPSACYWNGNTATSGTVCSLYVELYVTDVDGNGKKDITVVKRGKTGALSNRLFGAYVLSGNSTATTFNTLTDYSLSMSSTYLGDVSVSNYFLTGDYDGDGRTDWITTTGADNSVNLHLPALNIYNQFLSEFDFAPYDNCLATNIYYANIVKTADFDADGKDDIIVSSAVNYNYACQSNAAPCAVYSIKKITPSNLYEVNQVASAPLILTKNTGDFNGDGKIDVFIQPLTGTNANVKYSTGRNQTANYTLTLGEAVDSQKIRLGTESFLIGDYNGDGKSDIAHYYLTGSIHNFTVYYSNGLSFKRELNSFTFGSTFRPSAVTDFNGDGRDDIIDTIPGTTGQIYVAYFKPNNQELLLTKVKDGFERMTEFTYKLHIDPTVYTYTNPATNTYPLNTIMPKSFAVSKMTMPDGTGNMANTTFTEYTYADAITHKAGKGYLGYSIIKSRDNLTTITSEQTNDFLPNDPSTSTNFYLFGLKNAKSYYSTNISTPGTNLTLSTPTYQTIDLTNKRFLLKTTKTVNKNYVADIENETNYTIDANGNATTVENKINAISTSTTKQTTTTSVGAAPNDFIAAPPSTIPSLPIEVTTTNSYNGSYSTTTKNTYVNGLLQSVINFYNTPKATTTTYEYDGGLGLTVGLLTKQSITLNQPLPSSEYTGYQGAKFTRYEYHDNKRTIKKTFVSDGVSPNGMLTNEVLSYDKRFNIPTSVQDGIYTTFYTNTTSIDAFGRVLSTTQLPNNITTTTEYAWDNSVTNGIYKVTTISKATSNTPQTTQTAIGYFDRFGRSIKTTTDNFSGTTDAFVTYDAFGRVYQTITPDASNAGASITVTNKYYPTYQNHFRLYEIDKGILGKTQYQYNAASNGENKIKVTAPNTESKEQTTDATGRLKTSTDAAGSITYEYNAQGNNTKITAGNSITEMKYDLITGEQIELKEPNCGTINYTYNGYGELIKQVDQKTFQYEMEYDILGRIKKKTRKAYNAIPNTSPATAPDEVTEYDYVQTGDGKEQLQTVKVNNSIIQTYGYDLLHRQNSITEKVDATATTTTLTTSTVYNTDNSIQSVTYPNSVTLNYYYKPNGFLEFVKNGALEIYKQTGATKYNAPTSYILGNGKTSNITYNAAGGITLMSTLHSGTTYIQNLEMLIPNLANGNITQRKDLTKTTNTAIDVFDYNYTKDQLKTITTNGNTTGMVTINYNDAVNSNVSSKTDVGTYSYDNTKKHQLIGVTFSCSTAAPINFTENQIITYTPFNKAATIQQTDDVNGVGAGGVGVHKITYTYSPDESRNKSVYEKDGVAQNRRYYFGSYEKLETLDASGNVTNTKHIYYINGGNGLCAIATKDNGGSSLTYNYVYTDHLGSILKLTNDIGTTIAEQSFDAWGRLRNPSNWSDYTFVQPAGSPFGAGGTPTGTGAGWLTRGYTGHEHVPQVDLINMNGRLYDAVVGRMLSADKYVADASNSQSYNRYSYCSNNPLKYTDPSGWRQQGAWNESVGDNDGTTRGGSGGYIGGNTSNLLGNSSSSYNYLGFYSDYVNNPGNYGSYYGLTTTQKAINAAYEASKKKQEEAAKKKKGLEYSAKRGEWGHWENYDIPSGTGKYKKDEKGNTEGEIGEVTIGNRWVPYEEASESLEKVTEINEGMHKGLTATGALIVGGQYLSNLGSSTKYAIKQIGKMPILGTLGKITGYGTVAIEINKFVENPRENWWSGVKGVGLFIILTGGYEEIELGYNLSTLAIDGAIAGYKHFNKK